MAGYGASKVERLMQDAGIVRPRQKIESAMNIGKTAESMEIVNDHVEGCEWRFLQGKASPTPTQTLRQ
ncbi:MAG: hypothetical protein DCF25_06445 [Leptolyngbya foveolarum]|uniref:Uncharacterized protein n=1 Tax=Leptolyngbya foveolarum TaxID=47253 RepID=A0A2W4UMP2_9CYAN|nr:MAG: hypothetical protein DCF25_06445 [Leptolyngbya foveolarum]